MAEPPERNRRQPPFQLRPHPTAQPIPATPRPRSLAAYSGRPPALTAYPLLATCGGAGANPQTDAEPDSFPVSGPSAGPLYSRTPTVIPAQAGIQKSLWSSVASSAQQRQNQQVPGE